MIAQKCNCFNTHWNFHVYFKNKLQIPCPERHISDDSWEWAQRVCYLPLKTRTAPPPKPKLYTHTFSYYATICCSALLCPSSSDSQGSAVHSGLVREPIFFSVLCSGTRSGAVLLAYACSIALCRGCGFLADVFKSYLLHSDLAFCNLFCVPVDISGP